MIKRTKSAELCLSAVPKLIKLVITVTSLTACSFQQYASKPLDPTGNTTVFESKSHTDTQFQQFLLNNGYSADQLPLQQWDLDALTYCALFFHPSLNVARAQWRAAETAELTAATKAPPNISSHLSHSDDPDPVKKPFAFGLSIDIPIETANKRDIRIENARHLSTAAKLEIAQTAWWLRNNVAQALTEYQFNQQQISLLTEEEALRQQVVEIYEKRLGLGAASNVELSTVKLQMQSSAAALNMARQNKHVLLAKLASNLGLPLTKVEAMSLVGDAKERQTAAIPAVDLQSTALLNRLDIRIALERYAAAEAKLKLEIAKQYPDLVFSPGYAFEFGDNIWSIGLSGLLTLLNKNKVAIAEATQLREVEAAQFEALQNKVILDANVANAEVLLAKQTLDNQQQLLMQQQKNLQRMAHQLTAGEIDRLALTYAKLENIAAEKNVASAHFQLNKSLDQLENTLQKPLAGAGVKNEP
ncbi:MAG: TolC family protein [Methylotenera sp.]|nr:TolC family protein [Methylotenera sp.]